MIDNLYCKFRYTLFLIYGQFWYTYLFTEVKPLSRIGIRIELNWKRNWFCVFSIKSYFLYDISFGTWAENVSYMYRLSAQRYNGTRYHKFIDYLHKNVKYRGLLTYWISSQRFKIMMYIKCIFYLRKFSRYQGVISALTISAGN